jgi:hypothetical protein
LSITKTTVLCPSIFFRSVCHKNWLLFSPGILYWILYLICASLAWSSSKITTTVCLVLYVFFFSLFCVFFLYAIASIQNPGWLLLLDPRAVQGPIICRCRHPDGEGVMQLRTRRKKTRKRNDRAWSNKKKTHREIVVVVRVCVLRRTKHTKLLLIVSGKREKKNGCATVDKKDIAFGYLLENAIARIQQTIRMCFYIYLSFYIIYLIKMTSSKVRKKNKVIYIYKWLECIHFWEC